jgi:nitrite reductase/ring-hydroxylating ferredoxin subunit
VLAATLRCGLCIGMVNVGNLSPTPVFIAPAAFSHEVKDKPVKTQLCGREMVLFRDDDGKVHAIDNACPHRSVPAEGEGRQQCRVTTAVCS